MCGICGYLSLDGDQPISQEVLRRMAQVLRHRGPDDEGYYLSPPIGLGIRRLSVIDLETGHQPIHNEDQTIWVVCNGEIYNFPELREDLEAKGHQFYTRSDTETMVHLYEELGEGFLQRLTGMFGLALWDEREQKLLLARDRMGEKPLHYAEVGRQLVFGSEIKSILQHPDVPKVLDADSLVKYLTYEFVPCPHTMFQGIRKLLPGQLLRCANGQWQTEQYWDVPLGQPRVRPEEDEQSQSERIMELLRESVRGKLISDVPLGVFLSGGIDSSSIVALATELSSTRIKTFTLGFEDRSFDESQFAKRVASYFGTEHYEDILNPSDMLEFIPQLTEVLDEPLGDASIIPTYYLSRFTRQEVTVALSGDGGDELFAGYPTYQAHLLAQGYQKLPRPLRSSIIEPLILSLPVSTANISFDFKLKRFVTGMPYPPAVRNSIWLGSFTPPETKRLLTSQFSQMVKQDDQFEDIWNHLSGKQIPDLLEQLRYLDMKMYLQDDILVKVDRAAMACSLETRAPMLDHNLVEYVATHPYRHPLGGFILKYWLKKAMGKYLPRGIANRTKKGFGVPVARWLKGPLKPLVLDMLSRERIEREGLFDYQFITRLLSDHFAGRKDNRKPLYTLLVFELWYRRYLE